MTSKPFYNAFEAGYKSAHAAIAEIEEDMLDEGVCPDCCGEGVTIICPDDMCRGRFDGEGSPCGDPKCVRFCNTCDGEGY